MKTLLLYKLDEAYLQRCAAEHRFAYGIIVGQHAEPDKDVVSLLAKNGEEDHDFELNTTIEDTSVIDQDIVDIDTHALANQWISARKMISGCFEVLGIFISSIREDITNEKTFANSKKLFYDMHNLITQGQTFSALIDDHKQAELMFLVYSAGARRTVCKLYTHSANGGSFSPVECRFVETPFVWHRIDASYEIDDIFPIVNIPEKINIESQFANSIDSIKKALRNSEIFIQNEIVHDDTLKLDAYIRIKHGKTKPDGPLKASFFLPLICQMSASHPIRVKEYNGTIRFSGIISSHIFCNPNNTMGDVKQFLCNDILRSLVARIQVYCDGLTETSISSETLFISEPPRRVYFNIQTPTPAVKTKGSLLPSGETRETRDTSTIQFSDYIFRGEDATVAVAQAKQILDLDIKTEDILDDFEDLAEDEPLSDGPSDGLSTIHRTSSFTSGLTRSMYMLGIAVSLLVLIVSILLQYLLKRCTSSNDCIPLLHQAAELTNTVHKFTSAQFFLNYKNFLFNYLLVPKEKQSFKKIMKIYRKPKQNKIRGSARDLPNSKYAITSKNARRNWWITMLRHV